MSLLLNLEVDEEILEHIAKQGIVLGVERIRELGFNPITKQWELLVSWRGLQEIEDSWEPLANMVYDVPVLVANYAEQQQDKEFRGQVSEAQRET
ncbi:hypothetical protein PF011_g14385 [Phytophthora fragariae]|uniref:Chromo domain-containing protein n=1 Tax=Phytophthora fragariae TaxID=53985 RepID=A0A6A3JXG9_9STRA|nr:hypothetical protein PF011_g14385 [Phytophthora fragariae]